MNVLGIILARAGSAGLTGKHLRRLCGKPVIEYTFDHAAQSRLLTTTIVSTDCPTIKSWAMMRGLPVVDRPMELATASASVQDSLLHAMDKFEYSARSFKADALVVLYGNVPVRPEGCIDQAIQLLAQTQCDSVRSFCPVGKWNPAWMSKLDGDKVQPLTPGSIHRRQDLEELFLHDGAVVAVSRQSMLRGRQNPDDPHAFFGIDRRAIRTEAGATVEIDAPRDLYWADAALRQQQQNPTTLQVRVA
jgi:CMP-N,N'-diacetyllegionaminic acid synthase